MPDEIIPPHSPVPAGWYPDHEGTMRWWDGQAWTSHTAPSAGISPTDTTSPPTIGPVVQEQTSSIRVGKLIGGIVLVLLSLISIAQAGTQSFANSAERFGYLMVPILMVIGGVWLIVSAITKKSKP